MNNFVLRGACAGWTREMLIPIEIADAVLCLVYNLLPLCLAVIIHRIRKGLPISFSMPVIVWTMLFILTCGDTHGIDFIMALWPGWNIDVLFHCVAAIISAIAAMVWWQAGHFWFLEWLIDVRLWFKRIIIVRK